MVFGKNIEEMKKRRRYGNWKDGLGSWKEEVYNLMYLAFA
jgi:hypothetical protein